MLQLITANIQNINVRFNTLITRQSSRNSCKTMMKSGGLRFCFTWARKSLHWLYQGKELMSTCFGKVTISSSLGHEDAPRTTDESSCHL